LQSISCRIEATWLKTLQDGKLSTDSSASPLFELAFVLVPLDHVASVIENTNHSIM